MLIISDVHGKYNKYLKIVREADYSLQLGDFGFEYDCLKEVDPNNHRLFFGNHDNYLIDVPHNIGDFGVHELGGVEFFFVRGGFSIDKKYRTPGLDWFPQEELNILEQKNCLEEYCKIKPDILISHECSFPIVPYVTTPGFVRNFGFQEDPLRTNTNTLLEFMIREHPPKLHIFGHFHRSWNKKIGVTEYRCLNELETFKL